MSTTRLQKFDEVKTLIEAFCAREDVDLPCAYYEFDEDEYLLDKYLVWWDDETLNVLADNEVYASVQKYKIALHIGSVDKDLEYALEDYLNSNGYIWEKDPPTYVSSEQMYEIVYSF